MAKWYIVHAHSGSEKRVAQSIKDQAAKKGMEELIEEVFVPVQNVVEMKKGRKTNAERKFFPGYVLVKMELNDDSWHLIKSIPKVTGFLGGSGNKPSPIPENEVNDIFRQVEEGIQAPKPSVTYDIGDTVKIVDGPFESFTGVVEGLDEEKSKLAVAVTIFGRATPVDLEYAQVEKV